MLRCQHLFLNKSVHFALNAAWGHLFLGMYLFNLATGQKADASEFFFGGIVLTSRQTLVGCCWGRFGETNLVGV